MPRLTHRFAIEMWFCGALAVCMALLGCDDEDSEATAPPAAAIAAKPNTLKIAFVYGGPIGNDSWTSAHERARHALQTELGSKIATSYVENTTDLAAAERIFRELVANGNTLIFGTHMAQAEALLKVAASAPEVHFEQIGSLNRLTENAGSYAARGYEGAYMAGVIAGKMTKSNILGVVGTFPTPEVIGNIDAFTLGAQSMNPGVKTKVAWVNSWFDPALEAGEAQALIDQGADVLLPNTDSPAVVQTAEKAGKLAFGWNSNMGRAGPHAHLASVVVRFESYYEKTVDAALEGSWRPADSFLGVKEGVIDLVSLDNQIPPDALARVEAIRIGLKDGSFNPWTGPIVDQTGATMLHDGEKASDDFLRANHVYVRGVE
jgi:simple sugar transport system substrate-binding protein